MLDAWVEILFIMLSGIALSILFGKYVTSKNELQKALGEVKTLSGFIPICSSCKKIRDDKGYWGAVEQYIKQHSTAEFTHSICPDCMVKLYPDLAEELKEK
jgi:hypothetical protein